eukprot:m.89843 g.89843  ORF g.89843 m.89843 type:complete len:640 (-) comp26334_c0_seq1:65-1984(-)
MLWRAHLRSRATKLVLLLLCASLVVLRLNTSSTLSSAETPRNTGAYLILPNQTTDSPRVFQSDIKHKPKLEHKLEHETDTSETIIDAKDLGTDQQGSVVLYGPSKSTSGKTLKIAIVTATQGRGLPMHCDRPKKPFDKFSGRCQEATVVKRSQDMHLPFAINHACYASTHGYTTITDTTNYTGLKSMIPTIRNQTHRGSPVDPNSSEWAEQRAGLDDRVPVPPYWNKPLSLQAHLPDYDWVVWADNDMWFMNMTVSISAFLSRIPSETYMVSSMTDINSFFAIRNSTKGRAYIARWLEFGLSDTPPVCQHKWGTFEYHDLGFWLAANIEAIQKWSGVRCDCFSDCHMVSTWTCFFQYAQRLRQTGFWPQIGSDLNKIPDKWETPPPIYFVDEVYDWFGINLAWGKIVPLHKAFRSLAIHSKNPFTLILKDGSALKMSNCFTHQHNQCVADRKCRAYFDADDVAQASCDVDKSDDGDENLGLGRGGQSFKPHEQIELDVDRIRLLKSSELMRLLRHVDGKSGCALPGCECWNCACQGASDSFGISNKETFMSAPTAVIDYWVNARCRLDINVFVKLNTSNTTLLQLEIPKFSERDCGVGIEIPTEHFNFTYLAHAAEIEVQRLTKDIAERNVETEQAVGM